MFFGALIADYFVWHYTRAWFDIWGVWRNFLWFVGHFFSIKELMLSLFAPFKRITEGRGDKFSFEDLAAYVIIGILSRVVGAFARITIICIGLLALLCTVVGGFIVYLFWMVAPFVIIGLLGASISMFLI